MKTADDEWFEIMQMIDEKRVPQTFLDSKKPLISVLIRGTDKDEHMDLYADGVAFHTKNPGSLERKFFVKRFDEHEFREVRK